MFTVGVFLLVAAAADNSCEMNPDGTCVGDFDDDFVSLAQLRATLARASSELSEDLEVDLADLASVDGTEAQTMGGWNTVKMQKGRGEMLRKSYVWMRKNSKGEEFWMNKLTHGRTKEKGPKGWSQVKKRSAAASLKKVKKCWYNGKSQYYCVNLYR